MGWIRIPKPPEASPAAVERTRRSSSGEPARRDPSPAGSAYRPTPPRVRPHLAETWSGPSSAGSAFKARLGPPTPNREVRLEREAHAFGAGGLAAAPVALSSTAPPGRVQLPDDAAAVHSAATQGSGALLPAGVRDAVRHVTGRSVDGVRVHRGAAAASAARQLGTPAYTVGNHVVLGALPATGPGERTVVAHEGLHAAQQAAAGQAWLQRWDPSEAPEFHDLASDWHEGDPPLPTSVEAIDGWLDGVLEVRAEGRLDWRIEWAARWAGLSVVVLTTRLAGAMPDGARSIGQVNQIVLQWLERKMNELAAALAADRERGAVHAAVQGQPWYAEAADHPETDLFRHLLDQAASASPEVRAAPPHVVGGVLVAERVLGPQAERFRFLVTPGPGGVTVRIGPADDDTVAASVQVPVTLGGGAERLTVVADPSSALTLAIGASEDPRLVVRYLWLGADAASRNPFVRQHQFDVQALPGGPVQTVVLRGRGRQVMQPSASATGPQVAATLTVQEGRGIEDELHLLDLGAMMLWARAADAGLVPETLVLAAFAVATDLVILGELKAQGEVPRELQGDAAARADAFYAELRAEGASGWTRTAVALEFYEGPGTESGEVGGNRYTRESYLRSDGESAEISGPGDKLPAQIRAGALTDAARSFAQLRAGVDALVRDRLRQGEPGLAGTLAQAEQADVLHRDLDRLAQVTADPAVQVKPVRYPAAFVPEEEPNAEPQPMMIYVWKTGDRWHLADLHQPGKRFEVAHEGDDAPPVSLFQELDAYGWLPTGTIYLSRPDGSGLQVRVTGEKSWYHHLRDVAAVVGLVALGTALAATPGGAVAALAVWTLAGTAVVGAVATAAETVELGRTGRLDAWTLTSNGIEIAANLTGAGALAAGQLVQGARFAARLGAATRATPLLRGATQAYLPLAYGSFGLDAASLMVVSVDFADQLEALDGVPEPRRSQLLARLVVQYAASAGLLIFALRGDIGDLGTRPKLLFTEVDGIPVALRADAAEVDALHARIGPDPTGALAGRLDALTEAQRVALAALDPATLGLLRTVDADLLARVATVAAADPAFVAHALARLPEARRAGSDLPALVASAELEGRIAALRTTTGDVDQGALGDLMASLPVTPLSVKTIGSEALGVAEAELQVKLVGNDEGDIGQRGVSGARVYRVFGADGSLGAVVKIFPPGDQIQEFARELSALQLLGQGQAADGVGTIRRLAAARTPDGEGVLVTTGARGTEIDRMLVDLAKSQDPAQLEALRVAVRRTGEALAELHGRRPGAPVQGASYETLITSAWDIMDQLPALVSEVASRSGRGKIEEIDFDRARSRLSALADEVRTTSSGASLAHGDFHPGNVFYDPKADVVTFIDTGRVHQSVGPDGLPIASPRRDVAAFYSSLELFGREYGLGPPQVVELREAFLAGYRQNVTEVPSGYRYDFYDARYVLGHYIAALKGALKGRTGRLAAAEDQFRRIFLDQ